MSPDSCFSLVVLTLAVNQFVEIWRHSELFAEPYAQAERMRDAGSSAGKMLTCGWCFSVSCGFALSVCWLAQHGFNAWAEVGGWWGRFCDAVHIVIWCFVNGLAASRGANLLNDLLKPYLLTPITIDETANDGATPVRQTDQCGDGSESQGADSPVP